MSDDVVKVWGPIRMGPDDLYGTLAELEARNTLVVKIVCNSPASFGQECEGHFFENEDCRGLDFCDGSSDIQHSDGQYWHWDADGTSFQIPESDLTRQVRV